MKKHVALLLVFALLCGVLSACGTAAPTEISEATATPTVDATPTESPIGSDYSGEWTSLIPDAYGEAALPEYMTVVNVAYELNLQGNRVAPWFLIGADFCKDQLLSYEANQMQKGDQFSYDLFLYNVIDNQIVEQHHIDYGEKTLFFDEEVRIYKQDQIDDYYRDRELLYEDHDGETLTTISKEVKGKLSGGIYDNEYKKGNGYAILSNTEKYAVVELSVDYRTSEYSDGPDEKYLQRNETGPQMYGLLDMDSGEFIKTYTLKTSVCYPNRIQFSEDDSYIILYFDMRIGGEAAPICSALVIDIEASLQSEE